jgi:hypothetical protein
MLNLTSIRVVHSVLGLLLVAGPGLAQRAMVDHDGSLATGGTASAIDLDQMEYFRLGSNGLLEYAFAAPASMSPAPSSFPRPAYVTASSFLIRNAAELDLRQDPADFRYLKTESRCDGSEVVRFEQTWLGIPVATSEIAFEVKGQIVRRVSARFVRDTMQQLPLAPPNGTGLRYVPTGTQTVVWSEGIEQLSSGNGYRILYRDPWTNEVMGFTTVLK